MNKLIVLLFLSSCAHVPRPNPDEVTVGSLLNLNYQSYLKGCIDGNHMNGQQNVMMKCRKKAELYIEDIRPIISK